MSINGNEHPNAKTELEALRLELVQHRRELESLRSSEQLAQRLISVRSDVSAALSRPVPIKQILGECAEAVVRNLDAAFARIWTLNIQENVLELQASSGLYTHTDGEHSRIPVGDLKVGWIAREKKPHLTNAVLSDPLIHNKEWARECGFVSFAGYPLIVEGRAVGVMAMFARQALADATLDTLAAISDAIAQGIERKRAEDELRTARARFAGILEIADDAIVSVNPCRRVVLFNQGAEKVFGHKAGDIIGQSIDLLLPERFLKSHQGYIELFAQSPDVARSMGHRRAIFGRRKDGSEFPAEASISKLVMGDEVIFTVILRDITAQQKAKVALEEALAKVKKSEAYLVEAQRLSHTGSFSWNVSSGKIFWSDEMFHIYQLDPSTELTAESVQQRIHPDDLMRLLDYCHQCVRAGNGWEAEYRLLLPDGSVKHLREITHAEKNERGELEYFGALMDVTESKQAEDAIRASENWARGQAEALTRTLEGLARESSTDRIVEHVLRTITAQLDAHSSSVWLRETASDLMSFEFALENDAFKTRVDATLAAICPVFKIEDVWPWPEVCRTGRPYVLEDIRSGADFPWRAHVLAQGVVSILIVPMLIAGTVEGVIGIRFTQPRKFRPEEMELAQSLAHQAMLAMQLSRLSAQSRESAVLSGRNRMARDIHDTLAQGFTGVIVQLEAAEDAYSKGLTKEAHNHVARAGKLARYGLSEARRSVQALRLRGLEDGDLCTAMDNLFRKLTADTGLHSEFSLRGMPASLPPQWEDNLLRIAQEVVTNALRYAHATEFKARLRFDAEKLDLELRDNGCGFDPARNYHGFGLRGMRERAEQMGGQISVQSVIGAGTTIRITLPLTENPKPTES